MSASPPSPWATNALARRTPVAPRPPVLGGLRLVEPTSEQEEGMEEIARRIGVLEEAVANLKMEMAELAGASSSTNTLIRWVVLPLIVLVGALTGVKLVLPIG